MAPTRRTTPFSHQSSSAPRRNRIDRLRILHLKLLERIADSGSLSGAAQQLEMSQPAATKMLQEIEAAFGASLIERTSRGARLNTVGALALNRLRVALGALDATVLSLSAAHREVPLIRVGMIPTLALGALPALAALLEGTQSLPRMKIQEATVERLISWLRHGHIDCVISMLEPEMKSMTDLDITPLWETSLAIATGPDHPLTRKRVVTSEMLMDANWALPPKGANARLRLEQWFLEAGHPPPPPFIEAHSFYTRLALVSSTSVLTVAPHTAVKHYADQGLVRALPLQRPISTGPMLFVTQKEGFQIPEVAAIKRGLQKIAE